MDQLIMNKLNINSLNFKNALDRIVEKYSKLQYYEDELEVDISNIDTDTLEHYISMSREKLNKLDSKLDSTCEDDADEETSGAASQLAVEESNETESLLDATESTLSESDLQPEDEDEELQMSLNSHSTLGELYPTMIRRLERAWDRQQVSVAADSVLKKYRRLRQQSKRGSLDSTFDVPLGHTSSGPKEMRSRAVLQESCSSPGKKSFLRSQTVSESGHYLQASRYNGQVQQQSPGKERCPPKREQHQVRVMDFKETIKPKQISLNETFTVSQWSPRKPPYFREVGSGFSDGPLEPSYAVAKTSIDPSFRIRGVSVPSHSTQTMCSTYALETSAVKDRSDIYTSPVKQSPFKVRVMSNLSRSPHVLSRSPKGACVEGRSRESVRPTLPSSPPERSAAQLRVLHPHSNIEPRSPHSASAEDGRHSSRRHLSFDFTQPSKLVFDSPKKIDEDFMKLYHKFVCQNKSDYLNGPPCRLCARSSEASRGHSSSSLAALALSPHRSLLRKRHRELGCDSHPSSKRLKEEYCTHSPGSSRHRNQTLRRRLSPFPLELPKRSVSCSPSKYWMQQPKADQDWMILHRPAPDCSDLGGSRENKMVSGYYPLSWLR